MEIQPSYRFVYNKLAEMGALQIPEGQYVKFKPPSFKELTVERMSPERLYIAHTDILNGDVMSDPGMEFVINDGARFAAPLYFRNDYMGAFDECDYDLEGDPVFNSKMKHLCEFFKMWQENITWQEHFKFPLGQTFEMF